MLRSLYAIYDTRAIKTTDPTAINGIIVFSIRLVDVKPSSINDSFKTLTYSALRSLDCFSFEDYFFAVLSSGLYSGFNHISN